MSTPASTFDEYVEDYEAVCSQGLRLSGESRDYFARRRVEHTCRQVPSPGELRLVVDFGCGLGHTAPYLAADFPRAGVVGVDTASRAVEAATQRYGNERVAFGTSLAALAGRSADLVYCNGVFHHIPPPDRPAAASAVFDALAPGGLFALWENNPWNPGTRLVMRRIPFDRDAITLSVVESRRLLRSVGFEVVRTRSYFYFPALLRPFRGLERFLGWLPLGAQYCVLGRKPSAPSRPAEVMA
jgi:SAM-dependent methyltransferase